MALTQCRQSYIWNTSHAVAVASDLGTTPEAAFEEAMIVIFERKEEVHRFSMSNTSRKHPDKARWTLFEMWPINVSLVSYEL